MTKLQKIEVLEQIGLVINVDREWVLSDYGLQVTKQIFGEIPDDDDKIFEALFRDNGLEIQETQHEDAPLSQGTAETP